MLWLHQRSMCIFSNIISFRLAVHRYTSSILRWTIPKPWLRFHLLSLRYQTFSIQEQGGKKNKVTERIPDSLTLALGYPYCIRSPILSSSRALNTLSFPLFSFVSLIRKTKAAHGYNSSFWTELDLLTYLLPLVLHRVH